MKMQVIQSILQGLKVIIKNPIILALITINAIIACIFYYFSVYVPELACTPKAEIPFVCPPELPIWPLLTLLALSMFLTLVIAKMVYDAVKGNASLSEAISLSVRKFAFVIIAGILWALIVGIGSIALIIPGVFLFTKFIFYSYTILLDNEKIINSFKKSWQIIEGNWWKAFGLYLIFIIPMMTLSAIAMEVAALKTIQAALVIDFMVMILGGWMISAFTIAYIQLTNNSEQENKEIL